MFEDDNKLTLVGEDGTETVCDILFTHEHNGKKYVVFEIIENEEVTAAIYTPNNDDQSEGEFSDIETDEEWDMLEKILDQYYEDLEVASEE
ncbi:MAG: DUF1292 domain-containing protein [Acholeplasmataceae bacterium]